jgi:hypothetical protein
MLIVIIIIAVIIISDWMLILCKIFLKANLLNTKFWWRGASHCDNLKLYLSALPKYIGKFENRGFIESCVGLPLFW